MAPAPAETVDAFHRLYYDEGLLHGGTWQRTFYQGVTTWKCPLDLWIYQEILHETRPDLIVECGTAFGGSALYLAHALDASKSKRGKVVSIDIEDREGRPKHRRIKYLLGSSTDEAIVARVRRAAAKSDRVMVILDSDHSCEHVAAELRAYADLVTKGCYLVVEDTNLNGHPVLPEFGPGPGEAVERFLAEDHRFEVDREREKLRMTFNPGGFLKKKRSR